MNISGDAQTAVRFSLRRNRRNSVESLRMETPVDLMGGAIKMGHHFLYASMSDSPMGANYPHLLRQFKIVPPDPMPSNRNRLGWLAFLKESLTTRFSDHAIYRPPGFVIVVCGIGVNTDFSYELSDVMEDVAYFWQEAGICCRVYLSTASPAPSSTANFCAGAFWRSP